MRRSLTVTLFALSAMIVVGCNKPKNDMALDDQDPGDSPMIETEVFSTDTGSSPIDTGTTYSTTGMASLPPPAASGVRTHVVQKGETLYSLARKYYNDQARWKDIYSANSTEIANPNVLKAGQTITIP